MKCTKKINALALTAFFVCSSGALFAQQRFGDNLGSHEATKNLDLNSNDLKNVRILNAQGLVVGTAALINNSVALQVDGNDKAILIPRVTNLLSSGSPSISNPAEGMIVYDLATSKFYVRNNTTWVTFATTSLADRQILIGDATGTVKAVNVTGDITIANTGVTTIGADKILSSMIKDGEVKANDIADGSITTAKIANNAVTTVKLQSGGVSKVLTTDASGSTAWADQAKVLVPALTDAQIIVADATGTPVARTMSGDVTVNNTGLATIGTGKVTNGMLASNAVSSDKILDGTVSTADLAANAVTAVKLASSTTTDADRAVGTNHVKDNSITVSKLATAGVSDANKILVTDATGRPAFAPSLDASKVAGGVVSNTEFATLDGARSNIQSQLNGLVPFPVALGAVVAWFPHLFSNPVLPASFVECNGQTISDPESPFNGVTIPNLNNSTYLTGTTGTSGTSVGSNSVSIAASNLPKVTVNGTSSAVSAGTPTGSVSIGTAGAHSHSLPESAMNFSRYNEVSGEGNGGDGAGTSISGTLSAGDHSHSATFTGNAMAAHNHTVSVNLNAGTQTAMENRPQSVTVRWIMRIK